MKLVETPLSGLLVIEPKVFSDDRGFFLETYSEKLYSELGIKERFVQDNFSFSKKNVLRGLHFQKDPMSQGKLVRVFSGAVFDVAVDIRPHSKTFGQWFGVELNAENKLAMYIPRGFAHGFCTLRDDTAFYYKCTEYYAPAHDSGILWNDSELDIRWPVQNPLLSDKDKKLATFAEYRK